MSYDFEDIIQKDGAMSVYNDNNELYKKVFDAPMREEMNKNLQKKINAIIKNKRLLNEPDVKELLALVYKMADQFDKITIYAFAATELRDYHRRKAGIL